MVKGCVMERVCQGARRWNGTDADRHAHALAERGYRAPSLAFPGLTSAEETVDSPGQEGHDSFDLPSSHPRVPFCVDRSPYAASRFHGSERSEEHTSELQSPCNLVCR